VKQERQVYAQAGFAAAQGLAAQVGLGACLVGIGHWSDAAAAATAGMFAFGGTAVWLWLAVTFGIRHVESMRALAAGAADAVADKAVTAAENDAVKDTGQKDEQRPSRWRAILRSLSGAPRATWRVLSAGIRLAGRHFPGIVSAATAAYLLWRGSAPLRQYMRGAAPSVALAVDPLLALSVTAGVAFVGFVASCYLAGLARMPGSAPLRSGVRYLTATTFLAFALAAGFALAHFRHVALLRALMFFTAGFTGTVGAEIAFSLFIGLYRPRRPGVVRRPAFDSRLLQLLCEPGHAISNLKEAIDYQFGFEISRSWSLQILARSACPLFGLSIMVLHLWSCLVFVEPYEQAVHTRFGRLTDRAMAPGIHLKAPWPIDAVRHYDVTRVRRIHVGSHQTTRKDDEVYKADVPILWTNIHGVSAEQLMIVAPPADLLAGKEDAALKGKAPSVSLAGGDILVEYRISDLLTYVKSCMDTAKHFCQVAELETSRELYRYDVDTLVGHGRMQARDALLARIRPAAACLGIEVLNVGLTGVHPPQDVAEQFHETVTARQEKETAIQGAEQYALRTAIEAAGTQQQAKELVKNIEKLEQSVNDAAEQARTNEQRTAVENLLQEAGGWVAEKLAFAEGYRWYIENSERAKAERFLRELAVYKTAPKVYRVSYYLMVLEQGLANARKYVIIGDRERLVLRFDLRHVSDSVKQASDAAAPCESGPAVWGQE